MPVITSSPQKALSIIHEKISVGDECNVHGDLFFGLGYAYGWADVAEKAGIRPDPKVPGIEATNKAFHHFRDDAEILRYLRLLLTEYGSLYVSC